METSALGIEVLAVVVIVLAISSAPADSCSS
jgi:hypothetical protein